ncbi:vimentin-type intermediate filament-associated coiled-coil protein [Spea bombifrons]|uniref:vimentin-type intermediate filament-associated coiled-coil protein n=1 Tax=Spea bombifrons TaxID=233779 RepID=UPI00234A9AB3|nr:vimentin-type intermediate filament-associated coiled-coil protein [Spea bombifrons]
MSALSAVQIKEANAHLAALHHRVAELEGTVREQAESLIRKDEQYRAAMREIADAKDSEISELRQRLVQSEEAMQRLVATIKEKDRELERLRHHGHLLAQMCRSRPLLDSLVSLMVEAEGVPCLPAEDDRNGLSNVPDYLQSEDDLDDSDVDRTLFGTTV